MVRTVQLTLVLITVVLVGMIFATPKRAQALPPPKPQCVDCQMPGTETTIVLTVLECQKEGGKAVGDPFDCPDAPSTRQRFPGPLKNLKLVPIPVTPK